MFLIQNSARLTSPKRWFYFLRFLRIAMEPNANSKLLTNTVERLTRILDGFSFESDIVVNELRKLLRFVLPPEEIEDDFPISSAGDEFHWTELPFHLIDICRRPTYYNKSKIIRMLEERRHFIFANFLVAEEMMNFLTHNPRYITKPEEYLQIVLNPMSPLYVSGYPFLKVLLSLPLGKDAQNVIHELPALGAPVVHSMKVCSRFYRSLGNTTVTPRQVKRLLDIFLAFPSVGGAVMLARAFIRAEFTDVVALILGNLSVAVLQFYLVYLLAAKFYNDIERNDKGRFQEALGRVMAVLPKLSRAVALSRLIEGRVDAGFALSLAETDDHGLLAQIEGQLKPHSDE
jgi:hypothetical protein